MTSTIESNFNTNINTSTDTLVGTYNGKPLYRRYYTGTDASNGTHALGTLPAGAATAWIDVSNSYFVGANGNALPMYGIDDEGWFAYIRKSGNAVMVNSLFTGSASGTFYVAVLYTVV